MTGPLACPEQALWHCSDGYTAAELGGMNGNVFVADHILLDVGLDVATRQLERLAGGGVLLAAAESAYGAALADLAEAAGIAAEPSRLAGVAPGELTETVGYARLAMRWEAIGANGALLPALDADLTLSPAGEKAALLVLAGVYRLPDQMGAALNPAIVRCFAAVTIRSFVARLACTLMRSAEADIPAGLRNGIPAPPAQAG